MRTWTEIDLDAIKSNFREIKSKTNAKILGIVKADAYGHGVKQIAAALAEEGVYAFGVSNADEAMEIRNLGFDQPILVLGIIFPEDYHRIIENNITITIDTAEAAKALSAEAQRLGKTACVHIKIDTGMGRIGFDCTGKSAEQIKEISLLEGIKITGIFSHMSRADEEDSTYSDIQFKKFEDICNALKDMGVDTGIRHIANSAATITLPHTHLDMVRVGMILYGFAPSDYVASEINLKPAMSFKTRVCHIKTLFEDSPISYGGNYIAKKGDKIATIPIGYADGFSRIMTGKAKVLVGGKLADVVGNICMDQCMIDVSHIENIKIGDEVIIFGSDGNNKITVETVALLSGTINYEIVCSVTRRVPRAYIQDNRITDTISYLE